MAHKNKKHVIKVPTVKPRSAPAAALAVRTGNHAGRHHTRTQDVLRGSSRKVKHRKNREW